MIQLGQIIKELSDKQSELGKLAKTESTSHDVRAHDYNESLAGKDFDKSNSEPWWKGTNSNQEINLNENTDQREIDFDDSLSNMDGILDESIPKTEGRERFDSTKNMNVEKGIEEKADIQKVENGCEDKINPWYCPKEGSGGSWEGERGNSKWVPDDEYTPQKHNPQNKTWGDVKEEHGIDGIDFNNGEPNFSEVSKGEVTLDQKETDRGIVFNEADTKLAEQKGCEAWEVYKWRKENGYTWHETSDGLRAQKVPNIVHGNISHAGGHSNNLKTL